ncbi:MAG: hypothetical protein JO016_05520 [Actinobacteria bacterium]|nr:hypothetical protein [Actinomycetota bacterium]
MALDLCYEIRVAGRLDEALAAAAFGGLTVKVRGGVTILRGNLDQAALHGVLERIRSLHLELLDARRTRRFPSPDPARWGDRPDPGGGPDGSSRLRDQGGRIAGARGS